MYLALRVRDREKNPKQPCKRHRKKDLLKEKILASMTKEGRRKYRTKQTAKAKKRKKVRKVVNIHTHELRLEDSRRIGKKHARQKARKKH